MAFVVRGNDAGRFSAYVRTQDTRDASYGTIGVIQGVTMYSTPMNYVISKDNTDGSPSAPCLSIDIPSSWRFRWVVKPGPRAIYIRANQNSTGSMYRPTLVVKANPNVGLSNDVMGSAPDGAGWTQIGPVSFTATGTDIVWVELHNNNYSSSLSPALFDHIITT